MTAEQRAYVDGLLRRPRPQKSQTLEELRAGFSGMMASMRVDDHVRTSHSSLGGRPALAVDPRRNAAPGVLLYFHGGGYVFGSPEDSLSLTSALVACTGIRSVSLDYRLAPEYPFPAALEDALAAYRDLLDRGIEPSQIAFVGDSAGGGIAATTPLLARDAGLPMPAAVVALSPVLDRTMTGRSMESKAGIDPLFTRESLQATRAMYLAGGDPEHEYLSPAVLADLAGYPPLLLQAGGNEVLLDDSTRMAERAWMAGVDVVLDVTAGVPHVFQSFTGVLDEADQALDRAALFLTQRLRA
ncbi:alpha/beta hydrolase [Microbacterium sp. STN6]|uniref:alpha/beta hydrolase n=1 Tax=Microbacterium sp. STN6 TaxID=2995588 RepID=UPI002260C2BE|nr:alpha/beta hydrolase [Microbacterium sp. STN6]MCX7522064.1 alpha/beta hydrolase [Microbacterium sp. STN6]